MLDDPDLLAIDERMAGEAAAERVASVFLLSFFTTMNLSTGFIVFTMIIFVRLVANLVTNNFLTLTPEQYEFYPFRIFIVERRRQL